MSVLRPRKDARHAKPSALGAAVAPAVAAGGLTTALVAADAALLAKAVAGDAAGMDAHQALAAATLGGAKAMGFDHLVGSLEPGKQADIACVDLSQLETQPLHHVASQIVYASGRHQVSDVWIAGSHKLRQRVLADIDLDGVLANARQWRERIASVRSA